MAPTEVDSRGTLCPQPIIDVARVARTLDGGTRVRLLADDPGADADVPAWARMRGHAVESRTELTQDEGGGVAYVVALGSSAGA
ncbi:sulfurtransferase TusA family protein [Janibacter sp. GS2]|uniref:sulfurtransferase TusA family protein n=1 Tax=Janibacter sp. GS2 TaxID=3442646 RepID=UPI003EBC46CB